MVRRPQVPVLQKRKRRSPRCYATKTARYGRRGRKLYDDQWQGGACRTPCNVQQAKTSTPQNRYISLDGLQAEALIPYLCNTQVRQPGDGSCLYHSLAYGALSGLPSRPPPPLRSPGRTRGVALSQFATRLRGFRPCGSPWRGASACLHAAGGPLPRARAQAWAKGPPRACGGSWRSGWKLIQMRKSQRPRCATG